MAGMHPVVGFDLDLTLIDSADGIVRTMLETARRMGRSVEPDDVRRQIGYPLPETTALLFGADLAEDAAAIYRSLYPEHGVPGTTLLAGVTESLAAVRSHGGRVVVVSAKAPPLVKALLEAHGLEVDAIVGDAFGEDKGVAIVQHGVHVFVGDHPGDMVGGVSGGATAVGVTTGSHGEEALRSAGAHLVLDSLVGFPAWLDGFVLDRRIDALAAGLRELSSVAVAFSGGADSAFLLAAAARVLGPENVLAVTAVSPSLPRRELLAAGEFAASLGVRHVRPRTDELSRTGYRDNDGDRCYFCKAELMDVVAPLAEREGIGHVATGTNADDAVAGFRPGIRAAAERGAVTPLQDAGLTKAQIREASRRWGLVTADKPAAACLSSRIAYGVPITPEGLARVDRAEAALRDALVAAGLDVENLRVRDLGDDRARIEVDRAIVDRVAALNAAHDAVRTAGFTAVDVDPGGFRSGSMNELLPDPTRFR